MDPPAFIMYADQEYKPGQEFTWPYGEKTNMELLYGYGFVIEKNLDDQIGIEVDYDDKLALDFCNDK